MTGERYSPTARMGDRLCNQRAPTINGPAIQTGVRGWGSTSSLRLQVFQGFCAFYLQACNYNRVTGEKIGRRRPRNVRVNDVGADKRREMMRGRDERSRAGGISGISRIGRRAGASKLGAQTDQWGASPGGLASDGANSRRKI